MGENTKPLREKRIFYGRQWISKDDISSVESVLGDDFITCGPRVKEAEEKLCEYTGAKHAVIVSNGTAALHCACMAASIKPGDEVITTPLTFAASANCVLYCGGKPVFADVNPRTYNIDPSSIRKHITNKTKAVIAVDFTGQAVEIDEIRKICKENNLYFIEDAAHAIGTKYKGQRIGSLADMTTFSFHPVKTITSGEGGAILTNDDELYKKLVLLHSHGIVRDASLMKEKNPEGDWYYEQVMLGFNYRITDFQAALLVSQMKRLDSFVAKRKEIAEKYDKAFSDMPEIVLQETISDSDTCRHLYIIRLNLDRLTCSRREFYDALANENIQPQVHYIPVYWFPYYKEMGYERGLCPIAENIYSCIMSIPLYPKMSDDDVRDVIDAVQLVVSRYRR